MLRIENCRELYHFFRHNLKMNARQYPSNNMLCMHWYFSLFYYNFFLFLWSVQSLRLFIFRFTYETQTLNNLHWFLFASYSFWKMVRSPRFNVRACGYIKALEVDSFAPYYEISVFEYHWTSHMNPQTHKQSTIYISIYVKYTLCWLSGH